MTAASDNADRLIRDLQSIIKNYRPDPTIEYRKALINRIERKREELKKVSQFGELGNRDLDL